MKNRMQELAGLGKSISYSAVVQDKASQEKILKKIGDNIPEGWEVVNHHSTINLGELDPKHGYEVGDVVKMTVSELGISDKAIALKTDIKTMNKIPHITVAINKKNGAKPVDSNKITDWDSIEEFTVYGTVEEVEK